MVRGTGSDSLRPERRSDSSFAYIRMVRDSVEGRLIRSRARSRLPGGTCREREILECVLVSTDQSRRLLST
jgi:hypothetical protein